MNKCDFLLDRKLFAQNDRIILRVLSDEDKADYMDLLTSLSFDKKVYEIEYFYNFSWKLAIESDNLILAVIDNTTNRFIGQIMLKNLEEVIPEIGVDITEPCRKKGFGYSAVSLFTATLKERFHLECFLIRVYNDNKASQALFHKFNVEHIGTEDNEYITAMKALYDACDDAEFASKIEKKIEEAIVDSGDRVIDHYLLRI